MSNPGPGVDAITDGELGTQHRSAHAQLFGYILTDKPHPQMGSRSCLGLIRLAAQDSPERMEAAAARALLTGERCYQSVKSILRCGLDRQPLHPASSPPPPPQHDNLRGPEYFVGKEGGSCSNNQ